MSISEAIMADTPAERDHAVDKVLLKAAVMREMFCPRCQDILDVRRAVLVTAKDGHDAAVTCGACYDRTQMELRARGWSPMRLALTLASVDVVDGRVKKPRGKKRAPPQVFRGVAKNTVTGEEREIKLTEGQVRAILEDEEHAECSGECECRIESDGVCQYGWPSNMRAVGMV